MYEVKQSALVFKHKPVLKYYGGMFSRNKNSFKLFRLCLRLIMTLLTAQQRNMLLLFKHFDMPYLYTHRGSPWKHHCNNLPPCLLCCHGSHPRIVLFSLSLPRAYDSQPAGETTIQSASHDVPPPTFALQHQYWISKRGTP